MGRLTTHVLDTSSGKPAAGLSVELWGMGATPALIGRFRTNADGRVDRPLLEGEALQSGVYELRFHVGDYFSKAGVKVSAPAFLDVVPIRFGIADVSQHYHVPLLLSPYGYSTYRGS